jgi:hypothetical protein
MDIDPDPDFEEDDYVETIFPSPEMQAVMDAAWAKMLRRVGIRGVCIELWVLAGVYAREPRRLWNISRICTNLKSIFTRYWNQSPGQRYVFMIGDIEAMMDLDLKAGRLRDMVDSE